MTPVALLIGFIGVVALWQAIRHFARARAATAGVIVVVGTFVLAAWLLAPGLLVLSPAVPSGQAVGWEFSHFLAGNGFDRSSATMIPMEVDHPGCLNEDWLGEPAIAYTPWSVTITMHTREPLGDDEMCQYSFLSGMAVRVQLSEPLGGRQLFDGSKTPPHPRSPGDTFSSMSR